MESKKYILTFLCCAACLTGRAQMKNMIRGKVVHGETGAAIPGASVFITNTSKGTVSDSNGAFTLLNVPEGAYDLIVSSIGYGKAVYSYKAAQLPLRLEIRLLPTTQELETVVVEPDVKGGWKRWGKFFTDNFLGTNVNGSHCRIRNYHMLRFRYSKKTGILKVLANEPLVIENKRLGYRLTYELENFRYDFHKHLLVYYGYSLFSELDSKGPSRRQVKNREKAWNGSIMHFLRNLYHDSLAAAGFEVRRMVRRINEEKQRVREEYRRSLKANDANADSAAYYSRIMRQPDSIDEFGKTFLTADSLLTTTGRATKSLFFPNYLYIVYRNEKEDPDYLNYMGELRAPHFQRSLACLPDSLPFTIEPTGNYYPPQAFMSLQYWAWNEKIGNMLPQDYKKE